MKTFPIRVVGLGPGAQLEEAEELHYLPLPKDMHAFTQPVQPVHYADVPAAVTAQVIQALQTVALGTEQMLTASAGQPQAGSEFRWDMQALPAAVRLVFDHSLATGEVSIMIQKDASTTLRIEETAFAGIWRIREMRHTNAAHAAAAVVHDTLEVAAIPSAVRTSLQASSQVLPARGPLPADAMNAAAILEEVLAQASHRQAGDAAHVINFTLLPMSQGDLDYISATLGSGPTVILSRGYGNCRISTTLLKHVWWVQYGNSMDQIILNTLEVVDVPSVALAAPEDIEDSLMRLRELIATLQAE